MKSIGYAVLALLLWWMLAMIITAGGTPLLTHGVLPRGDAFLYAVPAVLLLGPIYAIPIVLYLACVDALARLLAFPRNIAVHVVLLMVGSVLLFGLRSLLTGRSIRTSPIGQMKRSGAPQAA